MRVILLIVFSIMTCNAGDFSFSKKALSTIMVKVCNDAQLAIKFTVVLESGKSIFGGENVYEGVPEDAVQSIILKDPTYRKLFVPSKEILRADHSLDETKDMYVIKFSDLIIINDKSIRIYYSIDYKGSPSRGGVALGKVNEDGKLEVEILNSWNY